MKRSLKNIKVKELAALICTAFAKEDIEAVLTGGSCVAIYSDNKYQSPDLDFVTYAAEENRKLVKKIMQELGFNRADEGFFVNPNCPYVIEFLPPPLSVGKEPVRKISTLKTKTGTIWLLSPTDCVKDRLAAYYHWDDPQSLKQAIMVAKAHKVNLREIKRWSQNEGQLNKYGRFIEKLRTVK